MHIEEAGPQPNGTGHRLTNAIGVTALAASFLGASPFGRTAMAQEGAPVLDQVTVTARRREESLQTAPVAVSALSADTMQAMNTGSSTDIDAAIPNVMFEVASLANSGAAAAVFIRGIGQADFNLNSEPGVGIFVDGAYVARSVGSVIDLLELERVEVLRGPQGTLFGRNTIGGAINFVTKKPVPEFGGYADVATGSRDRIDFKGSVDIPFSDNVRSKLSFMTTNSDGYIRLVQSPDEKLGDENLVAARAAFQFLPADSLTVDLTFDVTSSHNNGAAVILTGINGNSFFGQFYNDFLTAGQCSPSPGPLNNPTCYNEQWLTGPDEVNGRPDEWRSALDVWGTSLTAVWNAPADLTLTSLSSYRHTDASVSREQDRSLLEIGQASNQWSHKQWGQEFQLAGRTGGRSKWLAGVYAFAERGTDVNDVTFSIGGIRSGGTIDNSTYAVYGNFTYDITSKLSVDLGVRYTSDSKRFKPDQYFLTDVFLGPPPPVPAGTLIVPAEEVKKRFTESTMAVSLSYQWSDAVMSYVKYSEGFKSGGFTQRVAFPRPDVPSFEPEFVKVYEVGAKTTSFDDRLRANLAVFYTDYTDLQVTFLEAPNSPAPITGNAASAEIKGAELELNALPLADLHIDASVGYLDARYTEFTPGAVLSVSNRPVYAPEWTSSLGVSYEIVTATVGVITPRIDYSYRSAIEFDALNDPHGRQGGHALVHVGVGWDINDSWRAAFDVNNVFDKLYITSAYVDLSTAGYAEAGRGRPREWRVSLRHNF